MNEELSMVAEGIINASGSVAFPALSYLDATKSHDVVHAQAASIPIVAKNSPR